MSLGDRRLEQKKNPRIFWGEGQSDVQREGVNESLGEYMDDTDYTGTSMKRSSRVEREWD